MSPAPGPSCPSLRGHRSSVFSSTVRSGHLDATNGANVLATLNTHTCTYTQVQLTQLSLVHSVFTSTSHCTESVIALVNPRPVTRRSVHRDTSLQSTLPLVPLIQPLESFVYDLPVERMSDF